MTSIVEQSAVDLSGYRILVVEDEAVVAMELATLIGQARGSVVGPCSSESALVAIADRPPNAAVVNLGGERTLVVLEALAASDIPFVICSGHMPTAVPAAFETHPFVAKPFLTHQFFAALQTILAPRSVGLSELLREAVAVTGADKGNVQRLDGDALRIVAQHGFERPFLQFFDTVKGHGRGSACGRALQAAQQIVVEDVATSPIFEGTPARDVMLEAGLQSVCSTPIVVDGSVRGMLSIHRSTRWQPSDAELGAALELARRAAALMV